MVERRMKHALLGIRLNDRIGNSDLWKTRDLYCSRNGEKKKRKQMELGRQHDLQTEEDGQRKCVELAIIYTAKRKQGRPLKKVVVRWHVLKQADYTRIRECRETDNG